MYLLLFNKKNSVLPEKKERKTLIKCRICIQKTIKEAKSVAPLNEVHIPKALPEYYIKYSQNENAKINYLTDLKLMYLKRF